MTHYIKHIVKYDGIKFEHYDVQKLTTMIKAYLKPKFKHITAINREFNLNIRHKIYTVKEVTNDKVMFYERGVRRTSRG